MNTLAKVWADKGWLFVETVNNEGVIEFHKFKADVIDYTNLIESGEAWSWLNRELKAFTLKYGKRQ